MRTLLRNIFIILLVNLFLALSFSNNSYAQTPSVAPTTTLPPTNTPTPSPTPEPTPIQVEPPNPARIQITSSFNKTTVKPNEIIELAIDLTNTSSNTTFQNVEIRVPFLNNITDTPVEELTPEFNKILTSGEFPLNFNNRSWLINSFEPKAKRTFVIAFKVNETLTIPNGLKSTVNLPAGWQDPNGLATGINIELDDFRVDLYYDGAFFKSVEARLPKVEGFDTEISFVKIPKAFEFPKTTDLKTISSQNIAKFENFSLETKDLVIEWQEPLDLSSDKVKQQFEKLDEYIISQKATLQINVSELDYLNKKATITFKDINLIVPPQIRVNEDVKQISDFPRASEWDKSTGEFKITLEQLFSITLLPNIEIKPENVELKKNEIRILGTVSHPSGKLQYKIINGEENNEFVSIDSVDISSGEFDLKITQKENFDKITGVEFSLTDDDTQQTGNKLVKFKLDSLVEEEEEEDVPDTTNISIFDNPLATPIFGVLGVVLLITLGYIGFLIYRAKKVKNKKLSLDKGRDGQGVRSNSQSDYLNRNQTHSNSTNPTNQRVRINSYPTKSLLDSELQELSKSTQKENSNSNSTKESSEKNPSSSKIPDQTLNSDKNKVNK